jgi:hypothetical protein
VRRTSTCLGWSTKGIRAIAEDFLAANPPTADAVRKGGHTVFTHEGRDMVTLAKGPGKGQTMSLASAARLKYI